MSIFIVGNFVDFTICKFNTSIKWGESCIASEIQSTIGNDAAIVAMVLAKLGRPIVYGLLNPITESLVKKMNSFGIQIQNLEINNSLGKTILLEDEFGTRTFISTYGKISNSYSVPHDTQYIYFDLYDENIENLENLLVQLIDRQDIRLFINLSSSNIKEKCCILAKYKLGSVYIQFSCKKELVESMIMTVSNILPYAIVIITCGQQGSYIFDSNNLIYLAAQKCKNDNFLGAGAFFSAFFINALFYKQSLINAQKYASKNVGILCKYELPILIDTINYMVEEWNFFE